MAISGTSSRAKYGWEGTFGGGASSTNLPFGHDLKLSTLERRNNVEQFWGLGNTEAESSIVKQYEGSWSADFVLGNAYWLRSLFGVTPTISGAGPHVHIYSTAAGSITSAVNSICIEYQDDLSTNHSSQLLGCVINTATLSMTNGEAVKVTLEGNYANELAGTSLTTLVSDTYSAPMTFQQASIELPDGTTLTKARSCEVRFSKNTEMYNTLGSRFASAAVSKNFDIEITATVLFENVNLLERFFGGTSPAASITATTFDVVINNNDTGTSERELHLTFGGVYIDTHSMPHDVQAGIEETITMKARTVTGATYTDNTTPAP